MESDPKAADDVPGGAPTSPREQLRLATAANDRTKYYLSLLQFAAARADDEEAPPVDLSEDRRAAGIEDETLDEVIAAASCVGEGRYRVPHARRIVEAVLADVDVMLEPLRCADEASMRRLGQGLTGRLRAFVVADLTRELDAIDALALARLAGVDDRADTLHQLVMEAHRALMNLERRLADAPSKAQPGSAPPMARSIAAAFAAAVGRGGRTDQDRPPPPANAHDRALACLRRHAALVHTLAQGLERAIEPDASPHALPSFAAEARVREREAEALVAELRADEDDGIAAERIVIAHAEEAADALEEASFRLALLPEGPTARARIAGALRPLADLATSAASGYVDALEFARRARDGADGGMRTLRQSLENLVVLDREAHARGRAFLAALMATPWPDARWLVLAQDVARAIERATAACMRAGEGLRGIGRK